MFMQPPPPPPPAGMRMQMAQGQLQGYPPQGMPIMGQPGAPVPPTGSPFYHGQMQVFCLKKKLVCPFLLLYFFLYLYSCFS